MKRLVCKAFTKHLDIAVDIVRINFDTKTVEALLAEDGYLHNDLCEYSFDKVELIVEQVNLDRLQL